MFAQLPTVARMGDRVQPTRVDISPGPTAVEETLEAMAAGTRIITGAHLEEDPLACTVDLLIRRDEGHGTDPGLCYAPVVISSRTVARAAKDSSQGDCAVVDLPALSLSPGVAVPMRHRAVPVKAQQLALAHVILQAWGMAAADAGIIGHAAGAAVDRCFFFPAQSLAAGLSAALSEPIPSQPQRVRECSHCEFHNHCRAQLVRTGDVSLLLPGDSSREVREAGIHTLGQLAGSGYGELSQLAQAWLDGDTALRRPVQCWITDPELWGGMEFQLPARGEQPMAEQLADVVDIEVDMEAHPQRGTFLWGTFDGSEYVSFSDYSSAGDGGAHVALLWAWLQEQERAAAAEDRRLRVWVYAAQGENYWLRHYARRCGGRVFSCDDGRTVRMPTIEEVERFISSDVWCDLFRIVHKALAGTGSLGLKTVAPLAGFRFSQEGMDGQAAVDLFEKAMGSDAAARATARTVLERYNCDDCVATRRVRSWLREGAPGISELECTPESTFLA